MADLLTLNEYKELLGIDPTNNRDDARITAMLPVASRNVRMFTDRKFEIATGLATPRTFEYDGDGFLEIDDATNITGLTTDAGYPAVSYPLTTDEWTAQPFREEDSDDPYYWMLIHGARLPASPEMGFEYNLDTLGVSLKSPTITVTADWGWPSVPEDVKYAAALSVQNALVKPSGDDSLQSEAIAGYSRSWAIAQQNELLSIPNRARDILINYQRVYG